MLRVMLIPLHCCCYLALEQQLCRGRSVVWWPQVLWQRHAQLTASSSMHSPDSQGGQPGPGCCFDLMIVALRRRHACQLCALVMANGRGGR